MPPTQRKVYAVWLKQYGKKWRQTETMELSIVIVSYNVSNYLKQAIESVIIASEKIKSEIIVVDNNSTDSSAVMVKEFFPEVNLIQSSANEGYGAACNKGIHVSSGEFILILNPDTIVKPETFQLCVGFMKTHPEAGALGARMTDGSGRFLPESKRAFPSPATSFFRMSGLGHIFKKSPVLNRYYLGHLPEDQICKSDILTGAFMFTRREALEKAGLFDTSFFMYGEDIDLSWRIVKCGYVNYFLPQVTITHFKGKSASLYDPERIRYFYEAMELFARKYFHRPSCYIIIAAINFKMHLSLVFAFFKRLFG